MDLIKQTKDRDGPGRPKNVYQLSEDAETVFPKQYSSLAKMMMEMFREELREDRLKEKLADRLQQEFESSGDLLTALEKLGTYPVLEEDEESETRKLTFHQCPFYEVAKEDDLLCDVDQVVLEALDGNVEVESTIARGGETCVFHLRESDKNTSS
jgi:predicted ArsR family transcriptional regulator